MARRKKWRVYQLLVAAGLVEKKSDAVVLAREGKIVVNDKVMESLHYQVHPFKDRVVVNGRLVVLRENRQYFVLNKPAGVETTKENILPFLKGKVEDISSFSPVGRLDKETTGLLLVTNDGRLGRRVLDPLTKRVKVYRAVVIGGMSENAAERLRRGVVIEVDGIPYQTLPAQVRLLKVGSEESVVEISVTEGKKRQVRLMCRAVGHPVKRLERVAIAKLVLGGLKEGQVKEYKKEELYRLLFE